MGNAETLKRVARIAEAVARRDGYAKGLEELFILRQTNRELIDALRLAHDAIGVAVNTLTEKGEGQTAQLLFEVAGVITLKLDRYAPALKVICSWCQSSIGWKSCAPEQVGMVSHGVCTPCTLKMRGGEVSK